MKTTHHITLAPACFDSGRVFAAAWVTPAQGIAMSAPAYRLGHITGMTMTVVTANAAAGANRKRAAGYEAFEDPV